MPDCPGSKTFIIQFAMATTAEDDKKWSWHDDEPPYLTRPNGEPIKAPDGTPLKCYKGPYTDPITIGPFPNDDPTDAAMEAARDEAERRHGVSLPLDSKQDFPFFVLYDDQCFEF